ncbi:MAG: hypothetical protein J1F10_04910 [Muribaculaceae bacterium]|nr:hypothetical protein [Muribaculaceae bacterium]
MKTYKLLIASAVLAFQGLANASILDPDTIVIPTVNEYAKDLSTLDIKFTMPDGFKPVKLDDYFGLQYYKPWPGRADVANWGYSMILESNDEQGALLYPIIVPDKPIITFGDQMESELRHMNPGTKDITPLLTFVTEDDMSGYANADTAVIYSFDIKGPVLGKYSHIIGILLRKYAHQSMFLKIALSDEGLKNKDEYIKALLGSLKYGNYNSEKMVERERVIAPDCDLKFPHPQQYGSILPSFEYYINGKQKCNEKRYIYNPKRREKKTIDVEK